jgi:GTP-binding protein
VAGTHFLTVGDCSQIAKAIRGGFLQGRGEPRVAMVGRSNVGKSSLLNALLGSRLAQVSNSPGKTRKLHFYFWPEARKVIADLPGYGFAQGSKVDREQWSRLIRAYFEADPRLEQALVLLDARHGPTELDLQAIEFLSSLGIPVTFVFTKTDCLKSQSQRALRRREAARALEASAAGEFFWVSARTGDGLGPLARALGRHR